MRIDLMQNIPNWEERLQEKILEKKAFVGGMANLGRAALHGLGNGAKWGAGLGALYGGGKAALSDDPNASVIGGALKGGLKGGMMGAGVGAAGGAALRAGPQALKGLSGMAGQASRTAKAMGYQGAGNSLGKAQQSLKGSSNSMARLRADMGLAGGNITPGTRAASNPRAVGNLQNPEYMDRIMQWAR